MDNKLLLLHDVPCDVCDMDMDDLLGGSRKMPYKKRYNKATKRYSKRRVSRNKPMFMGNLGAGEGMKASFSAVKGVLVTGLIAAGGAVVTRKLFDAYGTKMNLTKNSIEESLAIGALGIGGGIIIAKFLKKSELGAAFAIGTVVLAGMNIIGNVLNPTAGLGYIQVDQPGFQRGKMAAIGATRVEAEGFHPQVMPMQQQEAAYGAY